jgi:predicted nucleotidyltransferase
MNLYSKTNMKLLTFLVRKDSELYEREISRASGLSIGAVNQGLGELLSGEFVSRRKKGRMFLYTVNHTNPLVKQFKIFLTVFELTPLLKNTREDCDKIILYGSCAYGTDVETSDIDLVILTREKNTVKTEIRTFSKHYSRKLSVTLLNHSEWLQTKKRDRAFYNEVNNGIILWRRKE